MNFRLWILQTFLSLAFVAFPLQGVRAEEPRLCTAKTILEEAKSRLRAEEAVAARRRAAMESGQFVNPMTVPRGTLVDLERAMGAPARQEAWSNMVQVMAESPYRTGERISQVDHLNPAIVHGPLAEVIRLLPQPRHTSSLATLREHFPIYRLDPIEPSRMPSAWPGRHSSPMRPAITHAEFNEYVTRLRSEGVTVVFDSSIGAPSGFSGLHEFRDGASYIHIGATTSFHTFIHEVNHARLKAIVNRVVGRSVDFETFFDDIIFRAMRERDEVQSVEQLEQRIRALLPAGLEEALRAGGVLRGNDLVSLIRIGIGNSRGIDESLATLMQQRLIHETLIRPLRDRVVSTSGGRVSQADVMSALRRPRMLPGLSGGEARELNRARKAYQRSLSAANYRLTNQIRSITNISPSDRTAAQNRTLLRAFQRQVIIEERLRLMEINPALLQDRVDVTSDSGRPSVIFMTSSTGEITLVNLDSLPVPPEVREHLGIPEGAPITPPER